MINVQNVRFDYLKSAQARKLLISVTYIYVIIRAQASFILF